MTLTRKRRRLQFSLRGLLLATTVLDCWLGWNERAIRTRAATIRDIDPTPLTSASCRAASVNETCVERLCDSMRWLPLAVNTAQ